MFYTHSYIFRCSHTPEQRWEPSPTRVTIQPGFQDYQATTRQKGKPQILDQGLDRTGVPISTPKSSDVSRASEWSCGLGVKQRRRRCVQKQPVIKVYSGTLSCCSFSAFFCHHSREYFGAASFLKATDVYFLPRSHFVVTSAQTHFNALISCLRRY